MSKGPIMFEARSNGYAGEFTKRWRVAAMFLASVEAGHHGPPSKSLPLLIRTYREVLHFPGVVLRPFFAANLEEQIGRFQMLSGDLDAAEETFTRARRLQAAEPTNDHRHLEANRAGGYLELATLRFAQNRVEEGKVLVAANWPVYVRLGGWDDWYSRTLRLAGMREEGAKHHAAALRRGWDGWAEYFDPPSYRWIDSRESFDSLPRWASTIVVLAEGGLGDQLQQLQMRDRLAAKFSRVIWYVRPELGDLVARELPHPHEVRSWGKGWLAPGSDIVAVRGTFLEYLLLRGEDPEPILGALRRSSIGRRRSRLTIGFSWKGGGHNLGDLARSSPLTAWKALLSLPDVRWVCLQPDRTQEEQAFLADSPNVVRSTGPRSFAESADMARACDLIIGVNSSLVHLGGVLGVPTWLLLNPGEVDGQWGAEGASAFWYRSVRILRQHVSWDWRSLLERVSSEVIRVREEASEGVSGRGLAPQGVREC